MNWEILNAVHGKPCIISWIPLERINYSIVLKTICNLHDTRKLRTEICWKFWPPISTRGAGQTKTPPAFTANQSNCQVSIRQAFYHTTRAWELPSWFKKSKLTATHISSLKGSRVVPSGKTTSSLC